MLRARGMAPLTEAHVRIDAHLHFWQPALGFDNRPVADHEAYRRDFMPADLFPALDACGIDAGLLVQTCPQPEETRWCLELAAQEPRLLGVTGWADLDAPAIDFAGLVARPKLIGIRAQLRRIADDAFVTRPNVVANLGAALRSGLNLTILAEPRHYEHVAHVLATLPAGPVTLNHLALPFPELDRTTWRDAMRQFARREDLYVQFSGLPFLYRERWREPLAQVLLDEAFDIFGPGRLLFASDYPMLLRFARYEEWFEAVDTFLDRRRVTAADRAAIYGGNALRAHPLLQLPAGMAQLASPA